MESTIGIYCIENIINNKKYIGSSKHVYKRRNRHFSELRNGKHKNNKLQNSYNKHGSDNFIFYVIEIIDNESNLIEREQYYINTYKPWYNINLIANSSLGVKRSEETKEKIRQANLGLKHPEGRNEIKRKAQGGDNNWAKGKKFSDEYKKKLSNSQKELYKNGYKNPNAKAIEQYSLDGEYIREWENCYIAARYYKCSEMAIRNNVKGRSKQSQGYIWKIKK